MYLIGKMRLHIFFMILSLTHGVKVKKYQKAKVASFEAIKGSTQSPSETHCSIECKKAEHTCEGFQFDAEKKTCQTLTNVETEANADESSEPNINVWIDTDLEAVQKAKNTPGSRVFLIGNLLYEKVFIEVWDLEDKSFECSNTLTFNPSEKIYAPGGGLVRHGEEFVPFLCGGAKSYSWGGGLAKCFQFNSISGEWDEDPKAKLSKGRFEMGSVLLDNNRKLVLTGGVEHSDSLYLDTIEVLQPNVEGEVLPITLPKTLRKLGSCAINSTAFIVVGGQDKSPPATGGRSNNTYIIDIEAMHIVNGPTLMEGRSDNACQTMTIGQKDYIVAPGGTGGTSRSGVQLTSTELLDLSQLNSDESAWISGPELPVANCDFELVPSSDSSSLYTIGACRSNIWDKVYKMTCPTDVESCIWEEHSSIKTGRGRGSLAIPLTGNMVNKLCYN